MLDSVTKQEASEIVEKLTPRERMIVQCITEGKTSAQICTELKLAEGTFRIHKHHIKLKMNGRPVWGWPAIFLNGDRHEQRS